MPTARAFCRFAPSREPNPLVTVWEAPGRACISAFVLITSTERPDHVLAGKIDPSANWAEIGALPAAMVETNRERWILPSSHLVLGESPSEAGARILAEQLGGLRCELSAPSVLYDRYPQRSDPSAPEHWDIGFVLRGRVVPASVPSRTAFRELRFLDLRTTERKGFGRMHDELLEEAGFAWARARRRVEGVRRRIKYVGRG